MPRITEIVAYEDDRGNRIIGPSPIPHPNGSVLFNGRNCTLILEEGVTFQCGIQFLQSDSEVTIGKKSCVRGGLQLGDGAKILIGENLSVTGNLTITVDDGATVRIGDDCLFAANVQLRAYDSHPIYDLRTGKRTNFSRSITIGNRVWMGYDSAALGGAYVGDGSIVGFRSVVTAGSKIPTHSLAVGQPAKAVKYFVAWAKNGNPPSPEMADLDSYPAPSELPYFNNNDGQKASIRLKAARKLASSATRLVERLEANQSN